MVSSKEPKTPRPRPDSLDARISLASSRSIVFMSLIAECPITLKNEEQILKFRLSHWRTKPRLPVSELRGLLRRRTVVIQ